MSGWDGYIPARECCCIGPQNGEPLCPCQMQGLVEVDGNWVRPAEIVAPVVKQAIKRVDCANCDKSTSADAKFCSQCGHKMAGAV